MNSKYTRLMRHVILAVAMMLMGMMAGRDAMGAAMPPVPDTGTYLGAILMEGQTSIYQFNNDVDIQHAVFMEFLTFPEVLEGAERTKIENFITACRSAGAIPALTLELPGGLNSYTAQQIEDFADFLNDFDMPMFLRWCHEMNGSWYAWGQQPTLYIAKFREFATVIHQYAPGVAMAWTPNQGWGYPWANGTYSIQPGNPDFALLDTHADNVLDDQDDPYAPYYPGDEYVDWVGHSFYHWSNIPARGYNHVPWTGKWGNANGIDNAVVNFHNTFAVGHNKPMLIAETSALYDPQNVNGGNASEADIKCGWIQQVYNLTDTNQPLLDATFPQIKLIFWFSQLKYEAEVSGDVDWRLNSTSEVIGFYHQTVTNAYFIQALYDSDNVTIGSSPDLVEPNRTYSVTVQYSALQTRDIVLSLLDPTNGYAWYGGDRVTVTQGQGSVTFSIQVQNDPPSGSSYVWDAIIVPEGGDWTQTLGKDQKSSTVVADELAFVSPPSTLRPQEQVNMAFNYTANPANEAKQLRVSLLDPTDNWALYGSSVVDLPEGSGTVDVPFTIQGQPAAGSQYVLDAYIARASEDWTKATAKTQIGVTVLADSLNIVSAPLQVQNGQTYNVQVSYSAGGTRYLTVNLLRPSDNYAWYGGDTVQVGSGSGTVTVQVVVQNNPPSAQDLIWDSFLSATSGDWQNATAVDSQGPVSVLQDALRIVNVPQPIQPNQHYTIQVEYAQSPIPEGKYVRVDLLDPSDNYAWYGGAEAVVSGTSGVVVLDLAVENDPPDGNDYILNAFIAPNGGSWSNATAADVKSANVYADSLQIASAPAAVAPNQTVSVMLSYDVYPATEGKYLSVNLLYPDQSYAWFGGTNLAIPAGTGQATVTFKVQGSPISDTDYVIDAFVARNGSDWQSASAHDQESVAMQVDTVSFNTYPSSIWTPNTWNVKLNYNVWGSRKIRVDLLTPSTGYVWRAGSEVIVPAGSGVASVNVAVPNTFPSGYHIWAVYVSPPSGSYETRTAECASPTIWVYRDPVQIISAPTHVIPGLSYDITLWWDVMQDSDAHIDLVRDVVYTWHGGNWANVGTGSGTRTFQVSVSTNSPSGSDYLWSSWVGPAGGGYEDRTDSHVVSPVTVTAP